MIKISSETLKTLTCLCGICDCDPFDKNCAWVQHVDKPNPGEEQMRRIIVLMKKEIALNIKKAEAKKVKKTNGKRKSK